MPFASTDGWAAVATALIGAISAAFMAYLAYLQFRLKAAIDVAAASATKTAAAAAVKVEEVKEAATITAVKVEEVKEAATASVVKIQEIARAQDVKLDAIAVVTNKVHTLVNSAMSAQLRISMVALRRLANLYPDNQDDVAAADLAEKLFREHEQKQLNIDASQ